MNAPFLTPSMAESEPVDDYAAWREALAYIARGYSGSLEGGHAESHSGTYCAEAARRALSEPDKNET